MSKLEDGGNPMNPSLPPDDDFPYELLPSFDIESPPPEFDEYEIIKFLGEGAMGKVYVARDTVLDREVAIKVINQPNPSRRERFAIEARAAARLQHPNIVTIYRVGEITEMGGSPYIAEEYIRGHSLSFEPKPVSWQRALELGIALARGLAAAHRRGVLHRDIKPDNVILSENGVPKLVDFGLAKIIDQKALKAAGNGRPPALTDPQATAPLPESRPQPSERNDNTPPEGYITGSDSGQLTEEGAIVGTPYYIPPELWRSESATPRADVYSFGVLLYELCAGKTPFGDFMPMELYSLVRKRDAPSLASAAPDVDPRFAAIVDRCLARDLESRYASGEAVLDALVEIATSAERAQLPEGSPYRGLLPFEAEHRALFFGRDRNVRAVIERLRTQSMVLVAGESGVGKSSLIRAGVLPLLADRGLSNGRAWRSCTLVPGTHPLTELAAELARNLGIDETELADELERDGPAACQRIRRHQGADIGLIVFVDQLEELVTLSDPAQANAICGALAWLAQRAPGVRLLATVRGDKLTQLARLPGLGRLIEPSLYILCPLEIDEIREVVVGPARVKGTTFESDALIDALIESSAKAKASLPLLQFALDQLWHARDTERNMITDSALADLGGVEGALARHADSVLEALLPKTREAVRTIMLQLVTRQGTRARQSAAELIGKRKDRRAALQALTSGRLVIEREVEGKAVCEIAHEALATSWPTLRRWLDDEGSARAVKKRLAAAAHDWDQLGRPRDSLLRGQRLRETEILDLAELPALDADLVRASRRDELRGRRTRRIAVVSAFLALAAVLAVVLQLNRQANAQRERAESFATESRNLLVEQIREQGRQALLAHKPMKSFAYLLEAHRYDSDNPATRFMLARAAGSLAGELLAIPAHEGLTTWVELSPDGERVVTASEDKTAKIWDARTGNLLSTLAGHHQSTVWMADFSPSGEYLATAGLGGKLNVWSAATGKLAWSQSHQAHLWWIGFSPDGSRLATASQDMTARLWDARNGTPLATLKGHTRVVNSAAFSPNGRYLVTGSGDGSARIWDVATGSLVIAVEGLVAGVRSLQISPDNLWIAASSWGPVAHIFPVRGGAARLLEGHTGLISTVRFSPDGGRLITGSEDGLAKVWDVSTRKLLLDLKAHEPGVTFASYSPDGASIVTTGRDSAARVWDARTGALKRTHIGHRDGIWMADFDARGDRLATVSFDGVMRIWDTRQTNQRPFGGENLARSALMNPDQSRVAVNARDGTVRVQDHDGALVASFKAPLAQRRMAWGPNGKYLLTFDGIGYQQQNAVPATKTAIVWDALSGQRSLVLQGHDKAVVCATYDRRGARIVTASRDQTARIWNAETGELSNTLIGHGNSVEYAEFDSTGDRVATASDDHTARIWDAKSGELLTTLEGHTGPVNAARFNVDATRVITAADDKTVKIWSATDGKLLQTIEETAAVRSAISSPDGRLIATLVDGITARVWDASSGQVLWSIDFGSKRLDPVRREQGGKAIDFSPDGRYLITNSSSKATLWDVGYDNRRLEELKAFAACRVSYTFEHGRLVRRDIDHEACRRK